MTSDLDAIALFHQTGPVVKAVAIVLVLSSVWCWAIMANVWIGLRRVKRANRTLWPAPSLQSESTIIKAGRAEANRSFAQEVLSDRRQRVGGAMRRHAQAMIERAQGNLGNLAVIASVAPFVGLFGTVWGIMTSFIGIAASKDTSLAVVAPGIAEALAATALGLATAIPAAFAYNRFVTAFGKAGRELARRIDDLTPEIAEPDSAASSLLTRAA